MSHPLTVHDGLTCQTVRRDRWVPLQKLLRSDAKLLLDAVTCVPRNDGVPEVAIRRLAMKPKMQMLPDCTYQFETVSGNVGAFGHAS